MTMKAQRRSFLTGTAALAAGAMLPRPAAAQQTLRQIRTLRGEVRVNGRPIGPDAVIRTGDRITTGPDGYIAFVVGGDAFMLRAQCALDIETGPEAYLITGLRLLSGALGAVFGKRNRGKVRVVAPTVTAGIRGTGCYVEARPGATYFCTCYGTIDMASTVNSRDRITATCRHHDSPTLFLTKPRDGTLILPGVMETHTDAEMEFLAHAAGLRAAWEK
ncbi:MAG: iron dicitrate transport regulator FecR [Burkholderiales bacterium]